MKFINKLIIILSMCILIGTCKTTDHVKVEDFKVNMDSPQFEIGKVDLQLDTMIGMGPLKKQTVTVLYFPREDAVCLRYKYEFYTYHQFWNKRGRLLFINALQRYNEDYDARNLQRNSIKTLQKYGTVRGYLVWQLISYTIQLYANMNIDLGYIFKDKSPYFTIYQNEAEYIDSNNSREDRSNPALPLYFTRAQAAELSEIFGQYITDNNLTDDYEEDVIPTKKDDVPRDDY